MTKNNSFDVDTICIHGAHKNTEPGTPVREPIVLSNIYHLPKDEEPNWSGVGLEYTQETVQIINFHLKQKWPQ